MVNSIMFPTSRFRGESGTFCVVAYFLGSAAPQAEAGVSSFGSAAPQADAGASFGSAAPQAEAGVSSFFGSEAPQADEAAQAATFSKAIEISSFHVVLTFSAL